MVCSFFNTITHLVMQFFMEILMTVKLDYLVSFPYSSSNLIDALSAEVLSTQGSNLQTLTIFLLFSFIVSSAICVITYKKLINALTHVIIVFFMVGILLLFLNFDFLAVLTLLIYVGAIMIFFLFAILLLLKFFSFKNLSKSKYTISYSIEIFFYVSSLFFWLTMVFGYMTSSDNFIDLLNVNINNHFFIYCFFSLSSGLLLGHSGWNLGTLDSLASRYNDRVVMDKSSNSITYTIFDKGLFKTAPECSLCDEDSAAVTLGVLSDDDKMVCWDEIYRTCLHESAKKRSQSYADMIKELKTIQPDEYFLGDMFREYQDMILTDSIKDICYESSVFMANLTRLPKLKPKNEDAVCPLPSASTVVEKPVYKLSESATEVKLFLTFKEDLKAAYKTEVFSELLTPSHSHTDFSKNFNLLHIITDTSLPNLAATLSELDLINMYGTSLYTLNSILLITSAVLLSIIIITALTISRPFKNI